MTRTADPLLPGEGRGYRAEAPSYQEVPGGGLSAQQRELSALVAARVEQLNPWKATLLRTVMPQDLIRYRDGRLTNTASDPTINLGGPSGQITAGILRSDTHLPAGGADVTWGGTLVPLTPREIIATTTVSDEKRMDVVTFDRIVDGAPVPNTRSSFDPVLISELAEAIARKEAVLFIAGAGTAAEPISGLTSNATISTQAVGATPFIDDFATAAMALRTLGRYPNAIYISASLAKIWRQAKGSTGGSYLFNPDQPLAIDGVPVYIHYGIPAGAATYAFVGDFQKVVIEHRILPGNILYQVAWSDAGTTFPTDQTIFRIMTRWDFNVVPGYGPSIVKITGINAP